MVKKSDFVRDAVQKEDWKKALQIAKDFHIVVTQEQREKMSRAYECIVYPDFYRQIGIDVSETIEQGKAVVREYAKNTRRENVMKWDVKHDKAKRVIDAFLENADYWQEREDLAEGLTDEEKNLVDNEVHLMIRSIRKRYKLEVRLSEQPAEQVDKKEPELVPMPGIEKIADLKAEYTKEKLTETAEKSQKPKKTRKSSTGTKKTTERKTKTKKTDKGAGKDEQV